MMRSVESCDELNVLPPCPVQPPRLSGLHHGNGQHAGDTGQSNAGRIERASGVVGLDGRLGGAGGGRRQRRGGKVRGGAHGGRGGGVGGGGDDVDAGESERLGDLGGGGDGRRREFRGGGGLRKGDGREDGEDEARQLHLDGRCRGGVVTVAATR